MGFLRLIGTADLKPAGRRSGRQSLGADLYRGDEMVLHVHFDGSDGKCQVRSLNIKNCELLLDWDLEIRK